MDKSRVQQYFIDLNGSHPQVLHFSICCVAAFVGETVTYPLDIVKTRLQVIGQMSQTKKKPQLMKLITSILKHEGILSLWKGLSPALYRHFLYTGARMPIYEMIRNHVFDMPPASSKQSTEDQKMRKKDQQINSGYLWRAAVGGIASGAIAQFISSPTDLLKVRLQTERRINLVHATPLSPTGSTISKVGAPSVSPPLHPNPPEAKVKVSMRQLIKEAGVLGLWRGGLPNVQRAALVNMGEMTTYDTAKRWLQLRFGLTDGPLLHGSASFMSGFVSALLGTPADLIKTRIMNQRLMTASGTTLPPLYTGMIDCATKVIRQEGFFTLYRGFFLIWARMAPWSLTFWLTYEKMRSYTGVGCF